MYCTDKLGGRPGRAQIYEQSLKIPKSCTACTAQFRVARVCLRMCVMEESCWTIIYRVALRF